MAFFIGCSAEKTNLISTTFHNTTAHYNSYFYAKEGIKEIESGIKSSYQNNFDHILKIYPPIDSSYATLYKDQIEDVLKKASLAIQNHKNSKWVDDSYNLVGLARLYGHEHETAIETFKYVNSNSDDKNARHTALVSLMRTFIEYGEMNNALAVSDYLKKEKLNKKNLKTLYLTRAYYYQKRKDLDNMVNNMVLAAPLLSFKDEKARIYFIIGQVYQSLGFESEAYSNYRKCLSSNPNYELSFYAKLNMAQVTELKDLSDVKRVRKYFRKLLTDAKNKEFRDKIYYEMGEFELEQNEMELAISYYKESIKVSIGNRRQKGLSFLKLGIIYYDSLRNYTMAQSYYDSAVFELPIDYENYEAVKSRQEILDDFIKQIQTIQLQDSLLLLANKDSSSVAQFFESTLISEREKEIEELQKQKKSTRSPTFDNFSTLNSLNSGISTSSLNWYFNNPSAVGLGQNEFRKIWGARILEDNWRRSNKAQTTFSGAQIPLTENGGNDETIELNLAVISVQVQSIMQQIPFTDTAKFIANKKIEEAQYRLGNIYHFNLIEENNSIQTFETLLDRYPKTIYGPEVMYLLYLILSDAGDARAEKYKNELSENYPNTTYAKLLVNPNYTEESSKELGQLKNIYKTAFDLYENTLYDSAYILISSALIIYKDLEFLSKLRLLEVMIIGKTEDFYKYKHELVKIIEEYPNSDITPFSKELLIFAEDWERKLIRIRGDEYINYFAQPHYFVLIFDKNIALDNSSTSEIEEFNSKYFKDISLNTGNLDFNANQTLLLVDGLETRAAAIKYYDYFKAENEFIDNSNRSKFHMFVITKDNFDVFYKTKDLNGYLKFFDQNY